MKVSLDWLKELVNTDLTPEELSDKLSLTSIGVKETTSKTIELDLTYNRGDLLSLRGVAREVAAITNSKITFNQEDSSSFSWVKDFDYEKTLGLTSPKTEEDLFKEASINEATTLKDGVKPLDITVEDNDKCSFYCLAKIEGLKVEPSPKEWVKRLEESGMRSINNVTDITNLIMVEFGQPLHGFDASKVTDEKIIVRSAKKGEELITLDNKKRVLSSDDLVIADEEKAIGLAGIMGGKNSEISDSTETILLEAAIFDPVLIRNSAKKHGLYSEASKRFIHGLSQIILLEALSAAIAEYQRMGGKLTGIHIQERTEGYGKVVDLHLEKLKEIIGFDIDSETVDKMLQKLGFLVGNSSEDSDIKRVVSPYYRRDIIIEEDVIEEVARIYGYEKIEEKPLPKMDPPKLDQSLYIFIEKLKDSLKDLGLTEVQTYSFYSTDVLNNMGIDKNMLVKVANPISTETEYLRFTLWENLLEVASRNIRKGFSDIAIFELGKVYKAKIKELPKEEYGLSMLLVNGTDNPIEELYGLAKKVMEKLGITIEVSETKKDSVEKKLFHPNRVKFLTHKGKPIGGLVEVHPRIVNKFGIDKRVAIIELAMEELR